MVSWSGTWKRQFLTLPSWLLFPWADLEVYHGVSVLHVELQHPAPGRVDEGHEVGGDADPGKAECSPGQLRAVVNVDHLKQRVIFISGQEWDNEYLRRRGRGHRDWPEGGGWPLVNVLSSYWPRLWTNHHRVSVHHPRGLLLRHGPVHCVLKKTWWNILGQSTTSWFLPPAPSWPPLNALWRCQDRLFRYMPDR